MTWRRRLHSADGMVLLCTLRWPEPHAYYLSQRYRGLWDFWVLPPDEEYARHVVGRFAEPGTPDRQVGSELLGFYLEVAHKGHQPTGTPVPALLHDDDLLLLLAEHQVRSCEVTECIAEPGQQA